MTKYMNELGFKDFVRKQDIKKLDIGYINNGVLTIQCEVNSWKQSFLKLNFN